MSVEPRIGHRLAMWMLAAAMATAISARAGDWTGLVPLAFADPLLTRPPSFNLGDMSGDSNHDCDPTPDSLSQPLTLSDAVALAWCHNPQIQAAQATVVLQATQVGEARAAYLPTLNVGMSRLNQKTTTPQSQLTLRSEQTSNSQYATLTWRLLDFGGRGANRRAAEAMLDAALASRNAQLQKTLTHVVGAYFDVQTAKANRKAKEETATLMRQTLAVAIRREARGAGAQSDTLQARTALAKAELESGRALGTHDRSMAALVLAVGLPVKAAGLQVLELAQDHADAQDTVPQDLASWLSLAQDQHPALLAARAQLAATQEKLTVSRSEGLPTLDFTQSHYVNGRPNQGLSSSRTTESVVGLTVNFPLFEGFARHYKVRGAEAQIVIKEAELRDTENQVLGEVVKAHADTVASLRNITASGRLIDAARAALDNVQRKYDLGIVDILEMLNVQVVFADAQQERVRALAEWRSARLRLLTNAGMADLSDLGEKS